MTAAADAAEGIRQRAHRQLADVQKYIGQLIFGQTDLIAETLTAFLAGGHILMTGAPGLAKTTLVKVFARCLGLGAGRIQFTPDLLPADILGSEILQSSAEGRRVFEFAPGPIFTSLLLADEINRAAPRTQSALLEAMQERHVTVAGKRHALPAPFMVLATQNPLESEGTFPLPEAQLDRFLMHTLVSYPDTDAEMQLLNTHAHNQLVGEKASSDIPPPAATLNAADIAQFIQAASQTPCDEEYIRMVRDLVRMTRPQDATCPSDLKSSLVYGASPRAGIAMVSAAKAMALIDGSDSVRWRHIARLAKPILRHRLRLSLMSSRAHITADQVIDDLTSRVAERYSQLAKLD